MNGSKGIVRPLAPIRAALERGQAEATASIERGRGEVERRLQQAEDEIWKREREIEGLQGILSRIAAIVGVDVGVAKDWNGVVAAVGNAMEQLQQASVVQRGVVGQRLEFEAKVRRLEQQAAVLGRIAGRLGVTSTDVNDILRAVDRLAQR